MEKETKLKKAAKAIAELLTGQNTIEEAPGNTFELAEEGKSILAVPEIALEAEVFTVEGDVKTPLEDGEFTLSTGEILTVESGKISDIKKVVKFVEEEEVELSSVNAKDSENLKGSIEALEVKLAELSKTNVELSEVNNKNEDTLTKVAELLLELSDLPAESTKPAQPTITQNLTAEEKAIQLGSALREIRTN